ncbi:E3 ubiquitin ligase RNF121-like [Corticium candelabrum]|uniref:E3 ubiquitin ligase RNF121-like n=1 Tax=Corticium candelabrum TaxID=121492 RepID=UPI002E253E01|nr:E3 ubiquitin ligase RNF121-like [Corticium candelabrum]
MDHERNNAGDAARAVTSYALDDDALERKRQDEFFMKHKGHEQMHAEMMIVLMMLMVIVQIVLFQWKRRRPRSYHAVTLLGLWLIPIYFALRLFWFRMLAIWTLFSLITGYIIFKATSKSMEGTTPRLVYRWFLLVYKLCYAVALLGYMLTVVIFLGGKNLAEAIPSSVIEASITSIFYGLYFGVLSRDVSELCTEYVAAKIGYFTKTGMPLKNLSSDVCAVCGQAIDLNDNDQTEKLYRLPCKHVFHEFCIRGWCIVGKKQTCPYCKEKVDLKRIFSNPWDRTHVQYANLLDFLRYFIVWLPVIIVTARAVNYVLGLE